MDTGQVTVLFVETGAMALRFFNKRDGFYLTNHRPSWRRTCGIADVVFDAVIVPMLRPDEQQQWSPLQAEAPPLPG